VIDVVVGDELGQALVGQCRVEAPALDEPHNHVLGVIDHRLPFIGFAVTLGRSHLAWGGSELVVRRRPVPDWKGAISDRARRPVARQT
jgi:hypothetical protein